MNRPDIINNDRMTRLLRANHLYAPNDMPIITKFSRFGFLNPYSIAHKTREYLFFTKPNLHLFDGNRRLNKELGSDTFFIEAMERYYPVMRTLQGSYSDTIASPFIPLLTNSVTSDMDLPSISCEESETASNVYGTAISYIRSSERSDENHEFSLEFEDNDTLELYMFFKIWDEYERRKDLGLISPPRSCIENHELHDQISVYKIIVGDDAESIIYIAKGVGVYPKGVPRETFSSNNKDEGITYSVSFHAEFIEDMSPLIVSDFNNDVNAHKVNYSENIPFYDESIGEVSGEWCNVPYIVTDRTSTSYYKLRWR